MVIASPAFQIVQNGFEHISRPALDVDICLIQRVGKFHADRREHQAIAAELTAKESILPRVSVGCVSDNGM